MIDLHCFHGISLSFSLIKPKCIHRLTQKCEKSEISYQKFLKKREISTRSYMSPLRKDEANFSPLSLQSLTNENDSGNKNEKVYETPMERTEK